MILPILTPGEVWDLRDKLFGRSPLPTERSHRPPQSECRQRTRRSPAGPVPHSPTCRTSHRKGRDISSITTHCTARQRRRARPERCIRISPTNCSTMPAPVQKPKHIAPPASAVVHAPNAASRYHPPTARPCRRQSKNRQGGGWWIPTPLEHIAWLCRPPTPPHGEGRPHATPAATRALQRVGLALPCRSPQNTCCRAQQPPQGPREGQPQPPLQPHSHQTDLARLHQSAPPFLLPPQLQPRPQRHRRPRTQAACRAATCTGKQAQDGIQTMATNRAPHIQSPAPTLTPADWACILPCMPSHDIPTTLDS
eukprot:363578-Chlamydomonas_euryale.AAC.7